MVQERLVFSHNMYTISKNILDVLVEKQQK